MRNARALTLQEATAAFVILGTGIFIATTVLFLELLIEGVQKAFTGASRLEQNQCVGEREPMPSAFEMEPVLFSLEMLSTLRISETREVREQGSRNSRKATLADRSKRDPMSIHKELELMPVAPSPDDI